MFLRFPYLICNAFLIFCVTFSLMSEVSISSFLSLFICLMGVGDVGSHFRGESVLLRLRACTSYWSGLLWNLALVCFEVSLCLRCAWSLLLLFAPYFILSSSIKMILFQHWLLFLLPGGRLATLPSAARKQEILKLTEQLLEAISAGDYETYA